ncbi:MAG TPA: hypothetical protein VNE17_05995 [Nitrolancea sp.]|nr:hypothetical protein [Nitrolancea sp.]
MDDVMLPYRTEWRSLATLLDILKGKGVDRANLEARMGAGESFRETLNAAEQLNLVRRDDAGEIQLTQQGRRLAYAANDRERQQELTGAMLSYAPYAIPLQRALAEDLHLVDGPWVERVWQVDMRLGQPRNRVEEARTFFFRLADDAGLGSYHRGVRGQPTRLELSRDARPRLEQVVTVEEHATAEYDAAPAPSGSNLPPGAPIALSLSIDMSDWELDKIEALLRLVGVIPAVAHD